MKQCSGRTTLMFVCLFIWFTLLVAGIIPSYLYFANFMATSDFTASKAIDSPGTRTLVLWWAGILGAFFVILRTHALQETAEAAIDNVRAANENATAANKTAENAARNVAIAERGLATERLTRAIELLASPSPSVRMGGIIGLEQIAKSEEEEREKIARVLSAHIREQAPKPAESDNADEASMSGLNWDRCASIEIAVKALANVSSEFPVKTKFDICNLHDTNLQGMRLMGINLSGFNFIDANLGYSMLHGANLQGSNLTKCNFTYATFNDDTQFDRATISLADFQYTSGLSQEHIDQACWEESLPPIVPKKLKLPSAEH